MRRSFKTALTKGELAEDYVTEYLESKGYVVCRPFTKDRAHLFDMLCSYKKTKVVAMDVKAKARLNKWNAQGINITHYEQYKNFMYTCNVPFYLIFVDEMNKIVHSGELKNLANPIQVNDRIIAWELSQMKVLFRLTDEQAESLKQYNQRNYEYKVAEI